MGFHLTMTDSMQIPDPTGTIEPTNLKKSDLIGGSKTVALPKSDTKAEDLQP